MPFTGNFSIMQGLDPSSFSISDTSTGSDTAITGRQIRLIQADGTLIYPASQLVEVDGVDATATITILSLGIGATNIKVQVNDPDNGLITLANYTKQSNDNNNFVLAGHLATAITNSGFDYVAVANNSVITITARPGLGSSINGNNRLSTTYTAITEIKAKAFVGGAPTGTTGSIYTTTVNDPVSGNIVIGTYTKQSSDTTDTILRDNLIANINSGSTGYTATAYSTTGYYVVAKAGLGSSINTNQATTSVSTSSSSSLGNFDGGVDATSIIPNAITQFAGGTDESNQETTGLTYINWPLSDGNAKDLTNIIDKDYALLIQVNWIVPNGEETDGNVYQISKLYVFTGFLEQFLYSLTQQESAKPNIINDQYYFFNKCKLRERVDSAQQAVSKASDQSGSQYCLDMASYMKDNTNSYF